MEGQPGLLRSRIPRAASKIKEATVAVSTRTGIPTLIVTSLLPDDYRPLLDY